MSQRKYHWINVTPAVVVKNGWLWHMNESLFTDKGRLCNHFKFKEVLEGHAIIILKREIQP